MKYDTRVYQLQADDYSCYFNILDESQSQVGIWGHSYKKILLLAQNKYNFELIEFKDEDVCKEWFECNCNRFDRITIINDTTDGKENIVVREGRINLDVIY